MNKFFKWYFLAFILLFSANTFADGETDINNVMASYIDAMRVYDTKQMASLIHPLALERFRASFDNALQGPKAEQAKNELLPLLSLNNFSEYMAISNEEAFQRLNDGVAAQAPELISMLKNSDFEIISTTLKDETAYVVYKLGFDVNGRYFSQEVVQKLKEYEKTWLLLLPATAETAILNVEARFN
ncbi:hypothetical protein K8B83_21420 [Shewanella inventionis]|uniref:DUF2059 domain-containing protein n=1 Tax=Shewanella inventionis TaxID=1738770 RepID=A0ABQ1IK10_9GAMM|nr:hypothetical protein [Shewanella inventionis]MCL1158758.1 hypothetical protein [Shewanella inventionis]UAL43308.1 hypothetical protein K8B83_21420 [Shewanella inventionis]GGB44285.1 hypothetical protein GCM10011607_00370 [Shewanella inventionis]